MDYTPPVTQQTPPEPQYELKKDITGKAPEPRGLFVLKDKNGVEVKLPHPPKAKCKKCMGRGFVGTDAANGKLFICMKCYSI